MTMAKKKRDSVAFLLTSFSFVMHLGMVFVSIPCDVPSHVISSLLSPFPSAQVSRSTKVLCHASRKRSFMKYVRGVSIATGQCSSFCGCAFGLVLGGFDHMEVEVQDRERVEARETEEEDKTRNQTNAQTCDDAWINMFFMRHALRHLEPQCGVNTCKVHENMLCEGVLFTDSAVVLRVGTLELLS